MERQREYASEPGVQLMHHQHKLQIDEKSYFLFKSEDAIEEATSDTFCEIFYFDEKYPNGIQIKMADWLKECLMSLRSSIYEPCELPDEYTARELGKVLSKYQLDEDEEVYVYSEYYCWSNPAYFELETFVYKTDDGVFIECSKTYGGEPVKKNQVAEILTRYNCIVYKHIPEELRNSWLVWIDATLKVMEDNTRKLYE